MSKNAAALQKINANFYSNYLEIDVYLLVVKDKMSQLYAFIEICFLKEPCYSMPLRIFSAISVLFNTIVIVIGPTPPGTGVIAPAISLTSS